jgi:hypothetical protein
LAPQAKKFFYGQATTSPLLNAAPSTPRARERERGAANQEVRGGGANLAKPTSYRTRRTASMARQARDLVHWGASSR